MIDETDAGVQSAAGDLTALSHSIHSEPELAFEEYRSAAKVIDLLRAHDFEIETGVADMPTAFVAEFGSGELTVGICAEYDALPEIGHACGHNIIAASAAGAAIALAPLAERLGVTIRVLGTPAEESGGGKVRMLERGVFDGIAAAVMVHPGPFDIVDATSLALSDIAVSFTGRAAHASAAPEWGINAGDAVTISQVAIGLLRQHLSPGQQLHGIVSEGGLAPNIVPGHAELLYYLRARTSESLEALTTKTYACFEAGAIATGCTYDVRTISPTYSELTPDPWLSATYRREAVSIGRAPLAPELEGFRPLGSTDMGNVTKVLPGIHPIIGLDSGGAVTHQPEFAAACVTASADAAVLDGARLLARTVVSAALDTEARDRLLGDLEIRTAAR
ncbi:M20 family metallopeptidase [Rhodococcoides yunnanense]|uniref:M20 family metallopeptidase n=1 Tax=Rhodococcoides yunnanense TaxID=278209 RepID=UPI0009344B8D|nr:M20 family metallopeptidase [Rhodococcus yunnanensis]